MFNYGRESLLLLCKLQYQEKLHYNRGEGVETIIKLLRNAATKEEGCMLFVTQALPERKGPKFQNIARFSGVLLFGYNWLLEIELRYPLQNILGSSINYVIRDKALPPPPLSNVTIGSNGIFLFQPLPSRKYVIIFVKEV